MLVRATESMTCPMVCHERSWFDEGFTGEHTVANLEESAVLDAFEYRYTGMTGLCLEIPRRVGLGDCHCGGGK